MRKILTILCLQLASAAAEAPQKFAFVDYRIIPLRVHRLQSEAEPALHTTLSEADIQRVLGKVNLVWAQAGLHLTLESIVTEAAAHPELAAKNKGGELGWLLQCRPEASRQPDCLHVYYIKQFGVNGVFLGQQSMVVKDTARLRAVEGGLDEPLPRVTSHEIGHALGLPHRQSVTNLMASGTTGWSFNTEEIKTARATAGKWAWAKTAPALLKEADALFAANKPEAAALYRKLSLLPLDCPEVRLAKSRTATPR